MVRGSGRMKLDDEIVEVAEWDAVRVPPGTWRGHEAGPDGLELLAATLAEAASGCSIGSRHSPIDELVAISASNSSIDVGVPGTEAFCGRAEPSS